MKIPFSHSSGHDCRRRRCKGQLEQEGHERGTHFGAGCVHKPKKNQFQAKT